ncbi:sphingosine kinase 2 isoform X3 [Oryza sativa Japonica Group]|uniref:sphingosine kinase 2 isoform X3 n=1 Tax=Oryza sativa subsp. japonica TaxID=39947 RepID=UPI000E1BC3DA|nr:sphingosine kinase 2 isoform X3 [Oryza sativa Japonica Group]
MGDHRATAKVRVNGAPAEATLFCTDPPGAANGGGGDGGELRWRCAGGAAAERVLSLDADVLGVEARGKEVVVKAFVLPADAAARSVSCAAGAGKGGGGRRRRRRDYVFEMAAGEDAAAAWCDRMRGSLDSLGRPKRLFILVNPFGGKKCGKKIYEAEIKPLFEAAGVNVTMQGFRSGMHRPGIRGTPGRWRLLLTLRATMALSVSAAMVSSWRLTSLLIYSYILFGECVKGLRMIALREKDILLYLSGKVQICKKGSQKVVNGILQRMDWEEAMKIPIGVVPAGTGNGMAKSLLHSASKTYSVPNAVFAIIRGYSQSLDVCTIVQGRKKFFSVLNMTWGLVADIDIESEKYRWMGSARFDFYALVRIMNLRKYYGSIQYVPAPGYEAYGDVVKQVENCTVECQEQIGKSLCSYQGPSVEFQGSEWRSLDGPFVSIWINNVQWAAESIMAAPGAKIHDFTRRAEADGG